MLATSAPPRSAARVTRRGSPPNTPMCVCTQVRAAHWSRSPQLPLTSPEPAKGKPFTLYDLTVYGLPTPGLSGVPLGRLDLCLCRLVGTAWLQNQTPPASSGLESLPLSFHFSGPQLSHHRRGYLLGGLLTSEAVHVHTTTRLGMAVGMPHVLTRRGGSPHLFLPDQDQAWLRLSI